MVGPDPDLAALVDSAAREYQALHEPPFVTDVSFVEQFAAALLSGTIDEAVELYDCRLREFAARDTCRCACHNLRTRLGPRGGQGDIAPLGRPTWTELVGLAWRSRDGEHRQRARFAPRSEPPSADRRRRSRDQATEPWARPWAARKAELVNGLEGG